MNTTTGIAVALAVAIALIFLFFGSSIFSLFSATSNPLVEEAPMDPTSTTLGISDAVVGTGAEAKAGDRVHVNYVGMFEDGTVFDASANHGGPYDFILGAGAVIPGWDQGLQGMREGGQRRLTVPPALGYGANDYGPIPGNSTLIFDVELVKVGE